MKAAVPESLLAVRSPIEPGDLPLRVPLQPRFLRELVVVPCKEELIVDGTERLQAVKSAGPGNMLLDLISLMDGKRTLGDLLSALPDVAEEEVLDAISSLYGFGLVEDGAVESEPLNADLETLFYLRRYVAVTGANRSGGEAYERLRNAEVLVFDSDNRLTGAACLQSVLTRSGVGRVVPLKSMLPSCWPDPASARFRESVAVSLSLSGEDHDWHEQLDDWCWKHRLPWLRVVLSTRQNYADFGPLFTGDRTPCYRCFQQVHTTAECSAPGLDNDESAVDTFYWAALAAVEIIYFLSRIGPLATQRSLERYDLRRQTSRRLYLLRAPGCSRCRPLPAQQVYETDTGRAIGGFDSAIVFEDYISLPARARTPASIQEDFAQISSFLIRQAKRMPNCPHVPLPKTLSKLEVPALEALHGIDGPRCNAIAVNELSTVLTATAGIRHQDDQRVGRWTATAGNLGSVELFVIVRRVDGLEPGVYFYDAHAHSLALFQQHGQALSISELIQRGTAFERTDLPDVVVLFTGAYHRLEKKYGEFAYKLVNLDAGVAVSQLHMVARSLGIFPVTATRWADDLIEQQLNLDTRQEQVTAVVALNMRSDSPAPARYSGERSTVRIWGKTGLKCPSDFCALEIGEVGERLYRESRMSETDLRSNPPGCPIIYDKAQGSSPSSPLPLAQTVGGLTVGEILARRTTVRNYVTDPVSPHQLATILDCAHRWDREQWGDERVAEPLTFYVLVWNVEDLDPGVYLYDSENRGLQLHAPARSLQESMELFVQPEFASAAAIIWITGSLAAASARLGALGHRYLLLRAGSAGHRLWSAALAVGLSGGVTAGVIAGAAREQFGLDGYQQVSLLAFATGVKAGYAQEPDRESE